jgi:hypothetical protein
LRRTHARRPNRPPPSRPRQRHRSPSLSLSLSHGRPHEISFFLFSSPVSFFLRPWSRQLDLTLCCLPACRRDLNTEAEYSYSNKSDKSLLYRPPIILRLLSSGGGGTSLFQELACPRLHAQQHSESTDRRRIESSAMHDALPADQIKSFRMNKRFSS